MARQYLREYSLEISNGSSKIITGLRISFEITKSLRSYPNIAKIDIYNPNEDTISILTSENPLVTLNAGYRNNLGLIFTGRVRNTFVNKIAEDNIITLFAADGKREWEESSFNKTLSENLNVSEIVNEVAKTFTEIGDVTLGDLEGLEGPANKLRGQTLSGSSKDIMDMLADDYNFLWSIQDGELVTVNQDKVLSNLTSVLIKQSTGMIGSPTVTEIGAEVVTLLNPELLPNRLFTIESESANFALSNLEFRTVKRTRATGNYRAYEVIFTGDTHDVKWYSTVKGTSL